MKKVAAVLAVILCFLVFTMDKVEAESGGIKLVINQEVVKPDVSPIIRNGRTLVPIRIISEKLGAKVYWDGKDRTVTIKTFNKNILLKIDQTRTFLNDKEITLDVAATIISNRTMLPLRFVSEALGASVKWDGSTRTVYVNQNVELLDVRYVNVDNEQLIEISGSKPMEFSTLTLTDPDRIVVDIKNCVIKGAKPELKVAQNGIIRIRSGQFQVNPNISRVVIDLERPFDYTVEVSEDGTKLIIKLQVFIDEVEVSNLEDRVKAIIGTSGPVNFVSSVLEDPYRVIIDIPNSVLNTTENVIQLKNRFIKRIRMAQFSVNPNTVRVVFDLKEEVDYSAVAGEKGIEVEFKIKDNIKQISYKSYDKYTKVMIELNSKNEYFIESISHDCIVINLPKIKANKLTDETIHINDGVVKNIHTVQTEEGTGIILNLPYYFKHEEITQSPSKHIAIKIFKTPLLDKLIVIDAGHGGDEPGAISPSGVMEKDLTLDIAKRLNELLKKAGANTFMIREADVTVPYQIRPDIANKLDADLFFSIHINAYYNQTIHGAETLYCPGKGDESKKLAQIVQNNMVEKLGLEDRGIWGRTNLVVLRETKMPAVLAEVGYLTHPKEEKMLLDRDFRQRVAEVLCESIIEYYADE